MVGRVNGREEGAARQGSELVADSRALVDRVVGPTASACVMSHELTVRRIGGFPSCPPIEVYFDVSATLLLIFTNDLFQTTFNRAPNAFYDFFLQESYNWQLSTQIICNKLYKYLKPINCECTGIGFSIFVL